MIRISDKSWRHCIVCNGQNFGCYERTCAALQMIRSSRRGSLSLPSLLLFVRQRLGCCCESARTAPSVPRPCSRGEDGRGKAATPLSCWRLNSLGWKNTWLLAVAETRVRGFSSERAPPNQINQAHFPSRRRFPQRTEKEAQRLGQRARPAAVDVVHHCCSPSA